ncbi:MAG: PAAR domain-containing protein [Chitinophagales bacterium]
MPNAVRISDSSNHGGTVIGPGEPTVLIGGMPAAVVGDTHICGLPPNSHQPTESIFPIGSTNVLIGGKSALRVGDKCLCNASVIIGEPTVLIN